MSIEVEIRFVYRARFSDGTSKRYLSHRWAERAIVERDEIEDPEYFEPVVKLIGRDGKRAVRQGILF